MGSIFYAKILNSKKSIGFLALMFVLPLVLTFIFGGMNQGEGRQTLLITDMDQTIYAQRLIAEIDKTNTYRVKNVSLEEMNNQLKNRRAQFGIYIPEGFHSMLTQGKEVNIRLIRTVENQDFYALQGILGGIIQNITSKSNIVLEGTNIFAERIDNIDGVEDRIYNILEGKWSGTKPLSTIARLYGEQSIFIDQKNQASLGFLLFFSMYPIIFVLGEILEDKRLLVWDRLIISPISKFKIYFSNLLFVFAIGFVQISLLMFLNYYFFEIEFGKNIFGVVLTVGSFVFTVSSMGLLISSFVKTNQQLSSIAPVIIVSTSMIGGLFWPSEIITNSFLQALARLTPQFWAMESMKKIVVYNMDVYNILVNILILFMMGIIFLGTAIQIKESKN